MPVNEGYSPRFLAYLHAALYSAGVNTRSIKQSIGIQNLDSESYLNEKVAVPPSDEQQVIANFLDQETNKIEELVLRKQNLIELLKEKRTALINQAVTKGLDPKVPMKDSGIDWLGDIPEHWDLRRMKYVSRIQPGKSKAKEFDDIEVSFIPMENIDEFGRINSSETRQLSDVYEGYTFFEEGDILVAKITPCFENFKGAIARNLRNGIGFGTTELYVIRPSLNVHADFLAYVTYATHFRQIGKVEMKGTAGQQRVPVDFIENFPCALPPYSEQKEIADFVKREMKRIDRLVTAKQRLIELLNEYRSALITAAVTGKIDVRGE